jgi:hypothetical protein
MEELVADDQSTLVLEVRDPEPEVEPEAMGGEFEHGTRPGKDDGNEVADEFGEFVSTEVVTALPHFYGGAGSREDNSQVSSISDSGRNSVAGSPVQSGDASLASISSPVNPGSPESSSRSSVIHSIDRRFHTRLSSMSSVRSGTMLNKQLESGTQLIRGGDDIFGEPDLQSSPWEPIRWSKLRKISSQLYSEATTAVYGKPTAVLPATLIAVGTSRGLVLVFDYQQNLKQVLGLKSKVVQWGEVTSLAVSADQTYIGVGYAQGHIITWDLNRPSSPNINIPPRANDFIAKPDKDGHLLGASVIHLSFVGKRHSALISGDVRGMAFAHDTVRSIRGRVVKTKRILGRYRAQPGSKSKPTTIFACAPRPLGTDIESPDNLGLVALMTPYLMVIVSMFPHLQTQLKLGRSKDISSAMGLSACLAWFPSLRSTDSGTPVTNSRLAYCWSNVLKILELKQTQDSITDEVSVSFSSNKRFICDESIVGVQWINRQVCAHSNMAVCGVLTLDNHADNNYPETCDIERVNHGRSCYSRSVEQARFAS